MERSLICSKAKQPATQPLATFPQHSHLQQSMSFGRIHLFHFGVIGNVFVSCTNRILHMDFRLILQGCAASRSHTQEQVLARLVHTPPKYRRPLLYSANAQGAVGVGQWLLLRQKGFVQSQNLSKRISACCSSKCRQLKQYAERAENHNLRHKIGPI
jgi:hypothetical protein